MEKREGYDDVGDQRKLNLLVISRTLFLQVTRGISKHYYLKPKTSGRNYFESSKALNALNDQLMDELGHALLAFDQNEEIGCMVITGSEKALLQVLISRRWQTTTIWMPIRATVTKNWEHILRVHKPVIAAVAGYALGGGCVN